MIAGIGVDIVETERIREIMKRKPRFADRILTDTEQRDFRRLPESRKTEYLAGRFAAKEAFAKALGTGIGKDLSFRDIEIQTDPAGKPFFAKPKERGVHLSISHSKTCAVAMVVIESP